MVKNKDLLIAGNWKMNGSKKNLSMISLLMKYIKQKKFKNSEILICPPNTLIDAFSNISKRSKLMIGAQDCSDKEYGAYTGDISPSMLKDIGSQAVILGHSERRQYQEESNKLIRSKAENALNNNLLTIVCVGESLNQKKSGNTLRVIGEQLKKSLPDKIKPNDLVIAYEPIWAIGSGLVPNNDDIYKVHSFISDKLKSRYGGKAKKIKILYGGSVNKKNASSILSIDYVDGALVGGASLKFSDFRAILDFCN
ncbi:MAG: triose-phosphate isomerase [Hyphomicrobiales bacterium]|jgi:triosephosphate isomerase|nr:triose-phosphate isomerase [Hyphomicrobiales bacterium]